MNLKRPFIVLPLLGLFFYGCSTQKNNLANREFHALNTKYNILFNGTEALDIGKAVLYQNIQDDFLETLPVEPILLQGEEVQQRTSIPSFSLAEEKAVKAIQKHSMNIEGKQYNRQIQKAYLLLGKARYYDRRFLPALEAFNFLLKNFNDQGYIEGKLWREKTNLRLGNTAFAVDNLTPLASQLSENSDYYAELHATIAQGHINLNQEEEARYYITQAALHEKKKEQKARYRYIEAQLLEKAQLIDSAQKAFQSIVDWNRKAPRVFWMQAKLQAERLKAALDSVSPLPSLKRLSNQFENQPFLHLIHQQQARYLLTQKQDSTALIYFSKSLQSPNINTATRMTNYRELANYYFEENSYINTGAYLDSLLTQLPSEGKKAQKIKREREGLEQVIVLEKIINSTDSILRLTKLTKEEQLAFFEAKIEAKRARELAQVEAEKKNRFNFLNRGSTNFYFYNNRLAVSGKQAFLSSWGNRPNIDDWNRLSPSRIMANQKAKEESLENEGAFFIERPAFFVAQIPTSSDLIDSLKRLQKQAYLDVGILYKEKFSNVPLALNRLTKALELNPTADQEVRALYHAYKLQENQNLKEAEVLKNKLLEKYPDSPYAQIILDPENFAFSNNQSPASIYEKMYHAFQKQEYSTVLEEGEKLKIIISGTDLAPKFAFLLAQTQGRLKGEKALTLNLEKLIKRFPNSKEAAFGTALINQLKKEKTGSAKKRYKWVFPFSNKIMIDTLIVDMKKTIEEDQRTHWKFSKDVYTEKINFLVIHTQEERPNEQYFLKKWNQFPTFHKKLNNFVLLSTEYEKTQRLKSWTPNNKQPGHEK